jgi:hypothetical protein
MDPWKRIAGVTVGVVTPVYMLWRTVPQPLHFTRYLKERASFEPQFKAMVDASDTAFEQHTFYAVGELTGPKAGSGGAAAAAPWRRRYYGVLTTVWFEGGDVPPA